MAVVLITGCSSGFGLETAVAFARRGDDVVATLRDPARGAELSQYANTLGKNLTVQALDVTDQGSINQAVAATLERHQRIDVMVNNAGIGVIGALEAVDDPTLRRVFDTNVFGAINVTRAVLPQMRAQKSGRVIFMNAIGGILNTAYLGAYTASKHALDGIAAVFDLELKPFGIHVSSVYPSAFHTSIADNMAAVIGGEDSPYAANTAEYRQGISTRIRNGPADLSPVVNAVIEAATSARPRLRYLVAPHLADVLAATLDNLDALHEREMGMTPGLTRRA
ncbi:MAG TPA: SDR family oxidoreductase [Chloroflexota bacterium]|jgi:NAD(P)-dependent dehydrogenase (short-subunit alcohol dehydrogenase family)|nr:SDR family oxidoreductase [Chloroflexota bacterium]